MQEKKLTGYPSIDKPWLKYYSEEAINAPLPECTMYEYLWENNKDHLGNIALNYYDRKITYGELFENIEKAAKAFYALGVKQGDIVVLATVTTPETIYAFYGLNRLGVVSNMVDPRTSTEGIKTYITEVDARLVLTIDAALPKIEKAVIGTNTETILVVSPADSLPQPKKALFQISNRLRGKTPKLSGNCLPWSEFIQKGKSIVPEYIAYQKDTCCVIVHTGGTTGTPKGVMLSNDNINALVMQSILTEIDMKREHNWLDIMPPFIAYGIGMGIHLPLVIGMENILIPSFDPQEFDSLLLKHRAIHMVFVPSYWETLINSKKMRNQDLSFIIAPTVGGDSMNEELETAANDFLHTHGCKYSVTKGYGMTEVCAGVTGTLDVCNEIGSVGVPFVKTTISIFDVLTNEELKYGEIGEICVSGPNVMLGYYNNPKATDEIIVIHQDGQRWVHSGDLGYLDESGSLFVIGRIKRIIVRYDGFKVFPSQIENVISKSALVHTCCVVGVADKSHAQGRLPIVYIIKSGKESDDAVKTELFNLCKNELPEYAQPIDFIFTEDLPLTPIGKIDYRALEKQAEEMKDK